MGALILVLVTGNAPTPLYVLWQDEFGFSNGVLTLVFVCYVVGVLGSMVGFGRLSDQIGRRPVILLALGFVALSAISFSAASSVWVLICARFFAGVATGLINGAATAALVELHPQRDGRRAALVASAATMGGIAAGPLLAGTLAEYVPAPTDFVFWVILTLVVIAALGVGLRTPHTGKPSGVHWHPQPVRVPREIRRSFTVGSATFTTGFAAGALFLSLGPSAIRDLLHVDSLAVSGGLVSLLSTVAVVTQLSLRGRAPVRPTATVGLLLVMAGLASTAAAEYVGSLGLFACGVLAVGAGQGMTWDGGLAIVSGVAPPDRRGEVMAAFYTTGYMLAGLLIVTLGFTANALGLALATSVFATVVAAMCAFALVTLARDRQAPCRHDVSGAAGSTSAP